MKTVITLTKEELEYAILVHLFSQKGWRLKPENVDIMFPAYGLPLDEVEITIK